MRGRLLSLLPLLLLLGWAASGCRRTPSDPVQALLERAVAAAEGRDVEALGSCLDPAFRGGERLDRAASLDEARRWFFTYQSLDLELADLLIERPAEGQARATFRVVMSGRPKEIGGLADVLPRSAVYAFEVAMARAADGQWLFISAAWRDAEGEPPLAPQE
jgi:hypothetical protein